MNNGLSGSSFFPGGPIYGGNQIPPSQPTLPDLPFEQSYIENILRLNKGKKVCIYTSYPDSNEWKDRKFKGIIEESGRDHIIISDPTTGKWYLVLMIYVNYIEFDEKINYNHEFSAIN
ncbi:MAG: spore coat protein GerQ [Bacilli bacterium]